MGNNVLRPTFPDFRNDRAHSEQVRDTMLYPYFYRKYFQTERIVYVGDTGCSLLIQQMGVDTIIQKPNGKTICIEEKIERYPGYTRTNFFLETARNRYGTYTLTWMHTGKADILLYAFVTEDDGLDVYVIPFPALQTWFHQHSERYKESTTIDGSIGRLVPIREVLRHVASVKQYHISPDGCTTFLRPSHAVSQRVA